VEKYGRVGQATDDNMAYAHCMLDTKDYKYKLRIGLCNSYYFSTAKVVSGTRLNVTLCSSCLSC
jgi:hypothetical protein